MSHSARHVIIRSSNLKCNLRSIFNTSILRLFNHFCHHYQHNCQYFSSIIKIWIKFESPCEYFWMNLNGLEWSFVILGIRWYLVSVSGRMPNGSTSVKKLPVDKIDSLWARCRFFCIFTEGLTAGAPEVTAHPTDRADSDTHLTAGDHKMILSF